MGKEMPGQTAIIFDTEMNAIKPFVPLLSCDITYEHN